MKKSRFPLGQQMKKLYIALMVFLSVASIGVSILPRGGAVPQSDATANSVIDKVEPLCRAMLSNRQALHFTATPEMPGSHGGNGGGTWSVECFESNDTPGVHVVWDATNARLLSINRDEDSELVRRKSTAPRLTNQKQGEIARQWLRSLHIATASQLSNSQFTILRDQPHPVAMVDFQLPDGRAKVWLGPQTGKLLGIHITPIHHR